MYYQYDSKWKLLRWYDPEADSAISTLTDVIQARPDCAIGSDGEECTLGQSGCWHVSIASMLSHFGQTYGGKPVNPESLLRILRDEGMGTLTGYIRQPFVDPVSIITKGEVQLCAFRDFGPGGASQNSSELIDLLNMVKHEEYSAIINVCSHEFFGKKDSHYVLAYAVNNQDYVMHDPGDRAYRGLFDRYRKFYQVTIYRNFGK